MYSAHTLTRNHLNRRTKIETPSCSKVVLNRVRILNGWVSEFVLCCRQKCVNAICLAGKLGHLCQTENKVSFPKTTLYLYNC